MSAKLKILERQFGRQNPERIPAPDTGLGAAIENMIADRVREELAKQPVKSPVQVQKITAPKPEAPDPAFGLMLDRSVRDQVALALKDQQERQQQALDMQLNRQQQALDMQRQQHAQQLDMQRQQHAQQMDMQRQFEAPAPVQTTPVQKPKPMQATIERDGAGLIRAMVVNGQRFLAQRDGAGKLTGIASEGV